jgi:hypothetical protein
MQECKEKTIKFPSIQEKAVIALKIIKALVSLQETIRKK